MRNLLKRKWFWFRYYQITIRVFNMIKAKPVKIIANLFFSKNPKLILLLFWIITIKIFRTSNNKIILLIISALVKTWTAGIEESTKYLLPIAPKIPPTVKVILESNSFLGIKNTIQEIKKDKIDPKNSLTNNQAPLLEITILKVPIGWIIFLSIEGEISNSSRPFV